jgi:hypothetical protein
MEGSMTDEELNGLLRKLKPEQREELEKRRVIRLKMCGFDLDDPMSDWINEHGKDHQRYLLMNRTIIYEEATRKKHGEYAKFTVLFPFFIVVLIACYVGKWIGGFRPGKSRRGIP